MTENPTWLLVVAAALRDREGRLLLQERPAGKHHALLWEFPGGKVEMQEDPRVALAREMAEELAITPDPEAMVPVGFADERSLDGQRAVVLLLYSCPAWRGTVKALDGQTFGWFTQAEAARLDLAPMDRLLLDSSFH